MRILIVHPRMNIKGGGEQVAFYSVSTSLNLRHDVTLLSEGFNAAEFESFYGFPRLLERVDRVGIPVFEPAVNGFLLYQRLWYYQREFKKVLRRQRFDLVLGTQDVGYTPSIDAPIVQYCHFPEYFRHLESDSASTLWRLYYRPARIYYGNRARRSSRFLCNSEYTRGFIRRLWNRDSSVLYPPCRTQAYTPGSKEENLAVTVGRIVPEKRLNLFLEIARTLPRFKFVVIGSIANRQYFDSLNTVAPTNVSFAVSSDRQSPNILAKAKVYVHCMENEHFGIAIVEAMAAGCVPVVHDSGGPREIVTPSVGYRWRTVSEAAGQITRLMQEGGLRDRLSKAAEERSKLYSTERFQEGLSKVIEGYNKA